MTADNGKARRQWRCLFVLCAAYTLIFLLFYPPTQGIEDEIGFINQAIVWSHGAWNAEEVGINPVSVFSDFIQIKDRYVSWRNPGRSLIVLPFIYLFGTKSVFLSGMIVHLITVLTAGLILARFGISPVWAVVMLFHPTLLLHSRTVMGDAPAAMFLILAVWALSKRSPSAILGGVMIGLATIMRYHAILALPPLLFVLVRRHIELSWLREVSRLLLAPVLTGILVAFYNKSLYNAWLGVTFQGSFSIQFLASNLAFYLTSLNLVWPFMLLAAATLRSPMSGVLASVSFPFLALFSFYYFHDRTSSWLETLVVGQRLLIAGLPALILMYIWQLQDISRRLSDLARKNLALNRFSSIVIAFGCLGLLTSQIELYRRHNDYLKSLVMARRAVQASVPRGSLVVANGTLGKLFGVFELNEPPYRWALLDFQGHVIDNSALIKLENGSTYVAALLKPGVTMDPAISYYQQRYTIESVATPLERLQLFRIISKLPENEHSQTLRKQNEHSQTLPKQ